MSNRITADYLTLMRQAPMTVHDYLRAAIKDIDECFGEGYAQKHPELVGSFLQASAQDFHTAVLAKTIQDAADQISDSLEMPNK